MSKSCVSFTLCTGDCLDELVYDHVGFSEALTVEELCKDLCTFILEYCVDNPSTTIIGRQPYAVDTIADNDFTFYNKMELTLNNTMYIRIQSCNSDFKHSFKLIFQEIQQELCKMLGDKKTNKRSGDEIMDELLDSLVYDEIRVDTFKKSRIS